MKERQTNIHQLIMFNENLRFSYGLFGTNEASLRKIENILFYYLNINEQKNVIFTLKNGFPLI